MNREIKFRIWDKVKNNWFTNHYTITQDGRLILLVVTDNPLTTQLVEVNKDLYEIQQFTGLKDKNGKEIYEGDIICTHGQSIQELLNPEETPIYTKGVVTWLREAFCLCQENVGGNEISNYVECHCHNTQMEIIGNIFENPDLLV